MKIVFATAFGTDERMKRERDMQMPEKPKSSSSPTEVIARAAESKIDRMNAATARLSRLAPAANLAEAIDQIVHTVQE